MTPTPTSLPAPGPWATPLHAAITYAALGWPVFPVHSATAADGCSCHRRSCPRPGKHPRTRHGLADASTSRRRVARWWARWPDANVAIATGQLVVIDVDGPDAQAALERLERDHVPLPPTLRARTARGHHLYFRSAELLPCSVGQLAPGLDVRGRGGYAIAPPSRHHSGQSYGWIDER